MTRLLAILLVLTSCLISPQQEDTSTTEVVISVQDDAYADVVCSHVDFGEVYGNVRCSSLAVTLVETNYGVVFYDVDLANCEIPVIGAEWDCTARIFKTAPLPVQDAP